MAADLLGSVPRHQADEERADHRHDDDVEAEMMAGRRRGSKADALIEEEIRKEVDQPQQSCRDVCGEDADDDCEAGYWKNAGGSGEIA